MAENFSIVVNNKSEQAQETPNKAHTHTHTHTHTHPFGTLQSQCEYKIKRESFELVWELYISYSGMTQMTVMFH